ncbi:polysaccharide pyruvyl transferase family protein [Providencia burhodogranariea]|uniref:Polysaccharide pyruvyl transferase domain-containing protein n=1 Tax=Providencia burhodogranariea DSM 19968 TaxID=1141662 RepID=K8WD07_9GAMM|nr:polysaccharide pyruvyl transferase family protein [Providencia burhodogranariea]EKT54125.1 hypothetical protein OOA_18044 [Providencia burhodogranariea DSM 19968]
MKIGILTQPLRNNYGGLLQAYALQAFLKKHGHDVMTVDFQKENKPRFFGFKGIALNITKKYIFRKKIKSILPLTEKDKNKINQHSARFIAQNINRTQLITSLEEFTYLTQYNFDAYIVGSDQVWRPPYSPGMSAFFLEFLKDDIKTKRIAYAASFGVDHCDEFSKDELIRYTALAKKFDLIGVREDSAVNLCDRHFGIKAEHVLDPTLLLEKDDYIELIKKDNLPPLDGDMMVYVLDQTEEKKRIISEVKNKYKLKPYSIMPNDIDDVYPPVTKWLKGFMDAKFIVTDSFHGVVFSIIFNKPFIAIGNNDRGLARFLSILKLFNLENHLIVQLQDLEKTLNLLPINYTIINDLLKIKKEHSVLFITNALGEKK